MTDLIAEAPWPDVKADVPSTMSAMVFREFGEPEVLQMETMPVPPVGPDDILVKVGAVSIGRLLDLAARSGKHPYAKFTFPHVLGAEHAGTVAALGSDVNSVAVGDHVAIFNVVILQEDEYTRSGRADISPNVEIIGTHRPGAYAEYSVVPAANASVVPDGVGPQQAAALASVGAVAANQFARVGGIDKDSRVIVQGATSALGLTTALLAKHLGAQVVVTSRHESKRERLRELGFDHVFDATSPDFSELVRAALGGGADVVVDNLGAPEVWEHGFDSLKPGGAIVSSGAFLGHTVPLNLLKLYSTGIRIIGVRTGCPESVSSLWTEVGNGFRTVVDRSFSLKDAAEAHRYVEHGSNVGKVVLVP
ncbi:quinone oxidoreductase family protein [Rhodococcus opacus]|uniref:Alcohol dehydrogenase n=1 Tax=Rhodococcus opacus TaxID=37919 RepID=A0A076EZ05_RHOOP|nr:zinc-binding dehydrogenase [Rhodococcus opacus]AII11016.1 alcohol dehydrogenase [Rhodococcus opacus]